MEFARSDETLSVIQSRISSSMTTTAIPPLFTERSSAWRILRWLAAILLLLVIAGLAYLYFAAHSALPPLDGRLPVRGLAAPVTVTRDSHGVPAIEASSLDDLFFAQGY